MSRVVVVGSGIAGLSAALRAHAAGHRVTIATKRAIDDGATRHAQGGIAGVMFPDDRVADHVRDTLEAGAWLGDPDAVRVLCEEGPWRIRQLIELGVAFDRGATGQYARGLEGAHSSARILHAGGDATGAEIERVLVQRVRQGGIEVLEGAFLRDLLVDGGRAVGVELLVSEAWLPGPDAPAAAGGATRRLLDADAVVLATGGAGRLFDVTSNPEVATGDGVAAAIRAGTAVVDLEFVQFHPTLVALGEPFLVSEAVRGEGAVLRSRDGRAFMADVHPLADLAPRDVVARAIWREMAASGGDAVLLDATAHSAEFLAKRFPTIDRELRARGLDWSREPVPVRPGAHYAMGGVATDLDGRTTLPGLYAIGETARARVHGANRLASNSLLEGLVFGARAAAAIGRDREPGAWPEPGVWARPSRGAQAIAARDASAQVGTATVAAARGEPFSRRALQRRMWAGVGLERDAAGLTAALECFEAWRAAGEPTGGAPSIDDVDAASLVTALEDRNLLDLAIATTCAALARPGSIGAHFRTDAPADAGDPAEPRASRIIDTDARDLVAAREA